MKAGHSTSAVSSSAGVALFRRRLLAWYDVSKRDLPWRTNRDPYSVWVSEIMLQQTRVAAVIDHYNRFMKRFPTVQKLASSREAAVLAAWSGLGYYRRARMLRMAAKQIVKLHGGHLPETSAELYNFPGIGRYTSAAIASIAFGEPIAVVDGNVERVMERLRGRRLTGEARWQCAEVLLSHKRPGDFNQAMMELGATICLPANPLCERCPVSSFCFTRGELAAGPSKARQIKRTISYVLNRRGREVFLVQREASSSLMAGMWELPEIEQSSIKRSNDGIAFSLRHSITVTNYTVNVVRKKVRQSTRGTWITSVRAQHLPLTGLARKILQADGFLSGNQQVN
jgi:A/G-specific adenine glycosylase